MSVPLPVPPQRSFHWSPFEPSWIVSISLVILAVLPHQIPATGHTLLTHPIGVVFFILISLYIFLLKPVVGMAMFILLASVFNFKMSSTSIEFFQPQHLNKDYVFPQQIKHRQRWLDEEILFETPDGIQDRTDEPALLFDKVTPHERSQTWINESDLQEHPAVAIQTRGVTTYEDGE